MTLLVAAGNRNYAVLITDRRFSENGLLRDTDDDDRNKIVLLGAPGIRLAVAFTGLARVGPFETGPWLANSLYRNLERDKGLHLDSVTEEATAAFDALPIADSQKLCWVLMVGFHNRNGAMVGVYVEMSNAYMNDAGAMRCGPFKWQSTEPADFAEPAAYALISHPGAVMQEHTNRLKDLALKEIPPRGLVHLGVQLIREAHCNPANNGTVGAQCSSVVVWADPDRAGESDYHPTRITYSVPTPIFVSPRGVASLRFDAVDGPAAYPSLPKRAPCPCGSGRRFGQCHQRNRGRQRITIRS